MVFKQKNQTTLEIAYQKFQVGNNLQPLKVLAMHLIPFMDFIMELILRLRMRGSHRVQETRSTVEIIILGEELRLEIGVRDHLNLNRNGRPREGTYRCLLSHQMCKYSSIILIHFKSHLIVANYYHRQMPNYNKPWL